MEKDLAAQIVAAVVSLDKDLGTLSVLIGRIENEDERNGYSKALGDVMGLLFDFFLLPIEREYPDLNPDK